MSSIPRETSLVFFQAEAPGAQAWAERHGWSLHLDFEALTVAVDCFHPAIVTKTPLRLIGRFDDYRARAPEWTFANPSGAGAAPFPAPGSLNGKASIFHSGRIICAPFNRLAYADGSGPHKDDWGAATRWLEIKGDLAIATTIGDMLSIIELHLQKSPGLMP